MHEYSRAWRAAANGEALDLILDTMTAEKEAEIEQSLDESDRELKSIWGD